MVNFVRRRIIKGTSLLFIFGTSILGICRSATAKTNKPAPTIHKQTLSSYLDVLIPADSTPSASTLEVDLRILEKTIGHKSFNKLLAEGTRWLNTEAHRIAGKRFIDLSNNQKQQIIIKAEKSPSNSLPNVFFRATLDEAYYFYYARPESWQGLGISRPPQPHGYLNHHSSPNEN